MSTKAKQKVTKIGKIEITNGDGKSKHVPTKAPKFVDHGDVLKTLAIGIRDNLPVLLIGESGTGKTSAIRYLAMETENGLRRVNLNGGTTADELVGRLLINEKGTYWVDGVLTEAMRNGDWIALDEINAALPEVLFVLQSVMDDDGYLVLTEKDDKEIVRKHPNFRLFASCNPPDYAGTKEMNRALLSRFPICINAETPPEKKELEIIEHHLGNAVAQDPLALALIKVANDTRKAKETGKSDYAINTRDILNTLRIATTGLYDATESLMLAFANKLDPADRSAMKHMASLQLPRIKKPKTGIVRPATDAKMLSIGGEYRIKTDFKNIYLGVTEKNPTNIETYKKGTPGQIIKDNAPFDTAVRGDEFVIIGFYNEGSRGADVVGNMPQDRIASMIEFTAGSNKGKIAVMLHHAAMDGTDAIFQHLDEKC